MAHGSHVKAQQRWQERLARFEASGLKVAAFCRQEQISEASFYHWRRRLADTSSPSSTTPPPVFQAITVTTVTAVLSIELRDGTRLQVPADQLELARVVVREVALATSSTGAEGERC